MCVHLNFSFPFPNNTVKGRDIRQHRKRWSDVSALKSTTVATTTGATANLEWRALGHQVDEAVYGAEVDRGGVKRFGRNLIQFFITCQKMMQCYYFKK